MVLQIKLLGLIFEFFQFRNGVDDLFFENSLKKLTNQGYISIQLAFVQDTSNVDIGSDFFPDIKIVGREFLDRGIILHIIKDFELKNFFFSEKLNLDLINEKKYLHLTT